MTDREMAQQIAEELDRQRNELDATQILMSKYRTVDGHGTPIPWRKDLKEQETLPEYRELMEQRRRELGELVSGAEFESAPILAVWKKYCRSRNR